MVPRVFVLRLYVPQAGFGEISAYKTDIAVCSIFLRVIKSINEIHKPGILNTIEVFYKKYVFIYYRFSKKLIKSSKNAD